MATKVQIIKSKIEQLKAQATLGKIEAQGISGMRYCAQEAKENLCTVLLEFIDKIDKPKAKKQ